MDAQGQELVQGLVGGAGLSPGSARYACGPGAHLSQRHLHEWAQ